MLFLFLQPCYLILYTISDEEENAGGEEEKKRQKRGGKGMLKSKKKEDVPKLVQVSRAPRGKKKSVTVVSGLSTFGMFTYFIVPTHICNYLLLYYCKSYEYCHVSTSMFISVFM